MKGVSKIADVVGRFISPEKKHHSLKHANKTFTCIYLIFFGVFVLLLFSKSLISE